MLTSVSGSAARHVSVLRYPVRSCVKILLVSIIYMVFMLRPNNHIHDVTNLLVIAIFWIKLLLKLPKFLTIQKRDRQFSVVGFASMLKPNVFEGTHYKRWRLRCILWLTYMYCYFVAEPRAVGPHPPDEERAFKHADTTFKAAILSVLGDTIVDAYVPLQTGKETWDAFEAKYGVF